MLKNSNSGFWRSDSTVRTERVCSAPGRWALLGSALLVGLWWELVTLVEDQFGSLFAPVAALVGPSLSYLDALFFESVGLVGVCYLVGRQVFGCDAAEVFALRPSRLGTLASCGLGGFILYWCPTFLGRTGPGSVSVEAYDLFGMVMCSVVIFPLVEETVIRGYLYRLLRLRLKALGALVATTAITLGMHYRTIMAVGADGVGLFALTVLFVTCCLLVEVRQSILPSIAFHVGYNVGYVICWAAVTTSS